MSDLYGKLESDRLAEENLFCRDVVRQLNDHGISDRQRLFLISLLSLELENIEHVQLFGDIIRDIQDSGTRIFLSSGG